MSNNVNEFYIKTIPLPRWSPKVQVAISERVLLLTGVLSAPAASLHTRLQLRVEVDALMACAYGLQIEEFSDVLLDSSCGGVGFVKTDANLPTAHRQPQLTLDAYRQLLDKGLDRFLQDGAEIPAAALAHRRPLIGIWSPEDGWDVAWAEARAMATSQDEWDLFLGKEEAVQLEYGTSDPGLDLAAEPARGQSPYRAEPQHGALFDPDEFRQDGQQRLL